MISVLYSCHKCGAEKVKVTVRERRDGEDVVAFVREVAREVGIHHRHRNCSGDKADLMIPAPEKGIGYA